MEKVYVVLHRSRNPDIWEPDYIEIISVHKTKEGATREIREYDEDWKEDESRLEGYEILEFELKD